MRLLLSLLLEFVCCEQGLSSCLVQLPRPCITAYRQSRHCCLGDNNHGLWRGLVLLSRLLILWLVLLLLLR